MAIWQLIIAMAVLTGFVVMAALGPDFDRIYLHEIIGLVVLALIAAYLLDVKGLVRRLRERLRR